MSVKILKIIYYIDDRDDAADDRSEVCRGVVGKSSLASPSSPGSAKAAAGKRLLMTDVIAPLSFAYFVLLSRSSTLLGPCLPVYIFFAIS